MNVYQNKQRWKLLLVVAALMIVGSSLLYTNHIADKIADDERAKIRLWAQAIKKKERLVKYTNDLFARIKYEERKKVELWAGATKILANSDNLADYTFILKVVAENTNVPVILTDQKGKVVSYRNLDKDSAQSTEWLNREIAVMKKARSPIVVEVYRGKKNYLYYKDSKLFSELKKVLDDLVNSFISEVVVNSANVPVVYMDSTNNQVLAFGHIDTTLLASPEKTLELIEKMKNHNPPLRVQLDDKSVHYIYYEESLLLRQLKYYPYFQFGLVGIFILISYWLFNAARKAEQNQVWVGMAKETAHQLGTPLSSLMAWIELFKLKSLDAETIREIEKDIKRLETITDRFSKIGSEPILEPQELKPVIDEVVDYIKKRSSKQVVFEVDIPSGIMVALNAHLFEWVMENLMRNSIDAMGGKGHIAIYYKFDSKHVIYIKDSGKGLTPGKHKVIFEPGYTTKKRGWGLGLSLAKRIIEQYHNGKIYVSYAAPNVGTTIAIELQT